MHIVKLTCFNIYQKIECLLSTFCRSMSDVAGQVEQKRLGIPREVPAAVQQWVCRFLGALFPSWGHVSQFMLNDGRDESPSICANVKSNEVT